MKSALLSMVAIATLAGVQAASVDGNNTAVVIRRENKASASGHQLMCVPVKPFNITGTLSGAPTTFALSEILPPALYVGCQVTLKSGTTDSVIYEASDSAWTQKDNSSNAAEPMVATGDVLWLYNPADGQTNTRSASANQPTVFCGEENSETPNINKGPSMQSLGNATSAEVSLAGLFGTSFQEGDQISRIAEKGHVNYTTYQYLDSAWYCLGNDGGITVVPNLSDVKIAPGEALYYLMKSSN